MRVLVTGACGFMGFELVKKLDQLGHEVIAFIKNNSKRSEKNFEVTTIRGDIRNPKDLEKVGRVDCIHHLAANADPTDFGIDMVETNTIGTRNVLELAKKYGSKVICASSSAVYGNLPAPNQENGEVHPLNAYGTTKMMTEYFCKAYVKEYHLDIIILRYFNTYGIGEKIKGKDASMVFHFIQSVLKTNSVEIYGDGEQKRDFIYVEDAIQANMLAMDKVGSSGETFNVGTGNPISFNRLIEIIKNIFENKIKIRYVNNPIKSFYQFHTKADMTRAKSQLDFRPKYGLEKGIELVLKNYSA